MQGCTQLGWQFLYMMGAVMPWDYFCRLQMIKWRCVRLLFSTCPEGMAQASFRLPLNLRINSFLLCWNMAGSRAAMQGVGLAPLSWLLIIPGDSSVFQ